MTRLEVVGVGYTEASAMLGDANRWAAVHAATLSRALADSGAMAGDSSFASEFAAAYDEAAAAVVGGFDDVVGGLGALCRMAYCSFENHARAELSSIASTIVVSEQPDPMSDDLYESTSPTPPSSLGGDPSSLPGWANVILDHVEGFVWPDADVDRLRSTAAAWRTASGHLDDLVDLSGRAMLELFEERSPEIPLATDAIARLRMGIRDLATACDQLAAACDDYADAVEEQRELILDLVSDLVRDAVLIAAAGFLLGLVTGGTTNAVAAWVNGGKLAAHVPRFKAFVETLRLYAASAAVGLRTTTGAVVQVRDKLVRFHKARMLVSGAERGSVSLLKPVTWLGSHEGGPMGAHTLARHVGKSNRYLRRRLADRPGLQNVSTFTNEAIAERSIAKTLAHFSREIDGWLANDKLKSFTRTLDLGGPVGRIMARDGSVRSGQTILITLRKDESMPEGFRILTSYLVG